MAVKKKIVLLQGAFDILHAAHIRAFKFAKSQGDYLIVALNTNRLIKKYKGRDAVVPWDQKKIIIKACRYVDKVIPAPEFSPLKLLKKHKVDVYIVSREWTKTKAAEFAYMKSKGGRVAFSSRSRSISTTAIKEKLLKEHLHATQSKKLQRSSEPAGSGVYIGHDVRAGVYPVTSNGYAHSSLRQRKPGAAGAGLSARRWSS